MALPGNAAGFTLVGGTYDDPSFQGMAGKLTLSAPVTHVATGERVRKTWDFSIDYNGAFSVGPLPWTDDPAFTPTGFTYSIEWQAIAWKDTPGNLTFQVPRAAGSTVDFDTLVPALGGGQSIPLGVYSVNGKQGAVTLSASDVGADAAGAATAAQAAATVAAATDASSRIAAEVTRADGKYVATAGLDAATAPLVTGNGTTAGALRAAFDAVPALATTATIYVHSSGSDSKDGRSWGTAKQTIPAAIAALGAAGGTVELGAGVHNVSSSGRIDYSCGFTNNSATVTDTSITAGDVGSYVIGQFIPDVAIIATVNPGVSFTLTDPSGSPLVANGTGTTNVVITKPAIIVPAGVRLRGRGSGFQTTNGIQGGDLDGFVTNIVDSGTGTTIFLGHPHQLPGDSGQTSAGFLLEDFAIHGNSGNQFGIAAINQWAVVVRNVHSLGAGTAGLLYGMNANNNRYQDCRFSGHGYNNNRVTGGVVMLVTNSMPPFGPVVFDNCFFTSNYGWGIVGTSDFTTTRGAPSVRVVQGQFNSVLNSPLGGGIHAAISGNEYRSSLQGCIFESAGVLDLDVFDNPVTAISCKFKATGGQNGTIPFVVRVNAGAIFDAIGCGFPDSGVTYQVQVATGGTFNWRSIVSAGATLAADSTGFPLALGTAGSNPYSINAAGSTRVALEPLLGLADGLRSSAPETMPRLLAQSSTLAAVSGTVHFTYFTATFGQTMHDVAVYTGAVAAGATPTYAAMGVYSIDGSGNLTLLGSCASDTTLFSSANAKNKRVLTTAVAITRGVRYAIGLLVVSGATMPQFWGAGPFPGLLDGATIAAALPGQSTLPASVTVGSLSATNALALYGYLSVA